MGNNQIKLYNDKEKWCKPCGQWLPLESFSKASNTLSGRRVYCKFHQSEWQRANIREYRYGVTPERFQEMLAEQDGKCDICLTPLSDPYIDHSHVTDVVRGLLCVNCNFVLGNAHEDVGVLERAIAYLRKHAVSSGHGF